MKSSKEIIEPTVAWFPAPVVLVSCSRYKKDNIITIAWTGVICSKPPLISISLRPTRFSYQIISETKEFVINIPTEHQIKEVQLCGTKSGSDIDKWRACNFTPSKCSKINSPLISECPINIECRVKRNMDIGTHTLFIGEVVAVHIDQQKALKSSLDVSPLCYSAKSGVFGKSTSIEI